MDHLKGALGGFGSSGNKTANDAATMDAPAGSTSGDSHKSGGGGFLGGLGNKLNSAAGGGPESEKNEDYLDKGIDMIQEKFMGAGPQNNESAIEQAKDEQISDFLRGQYKSVAGSDIPIKDKDTRFG